MPPKFWLPPTFFVSGLLNGHDLQRKFPSLELLVRCPSVIPDEPDRLRALAQYGLSTERPLPSLDPIVQIAIHAFDMPAAAVNMIGRDEVFFAASAGIGDCDMGRDVSFCAHAITQDDVMVVEDARLDARFHDNPLVTSAQIRFYAGVPVRSPDGHALGALCLVDSKPHSSFSDQDRARLKELAKLVSDRLELRRLEVARQGGAGRFEHIAMNSPNGIVCFGGDGIVTALNPAAAKVFGRTAEDVVGSRLDLLLPTWRQSRIVQLMDQPISGESPAVDIQEDFLARRNNGSEFPLEAVWSAWLDDEEPHFGLVIRDLTEQRRQEDELNRLANFDQATGLPNRNLLQQRLGEEMAGVRPVAVLVLGLHGFQDINHTLGQSAGDRMLRQIADRLMSCIRPIDFLAAGSSGEFAILLTGIADPLRSADVAMAAMAAIAQPISIGGEEFRIGAHCGVALSPSHGCAVEELIGNANLALDEARKGVTGKFFLFQQALRAKAVARRMFDAELHQALEREEFQLYFQPQVRISDGALAGAEALLRWNHPERGVLSPAAFLPALEASALATVVGNWVIDTACRQASEWRASLWPGLRMGVNLFAAQFRSGDLRAFVCGALDRHDLPHEAIELEITETTVLDEEALFLPLLHGLRKEGIKLAFDDFGTGYASLSLLNQYPLTHVKIDKSFVQKAVSSDRDRAIIHAITELAQRLDLEVIAEGVETSGEFALCREIGCDEVQGYLTGRPMTADQFQRAWQLRPQSVASSTAAVAG